MIWMFEVFELRTQIHIIDTRIKVEGDAGYLIIKSQSDDWRDQRPWLIKIIRGDTDARSYSDMSLNCVFVCCVELSKT